MSDHQSTTSPTPNQNSATVRVLLVFGLATLLNVHISLWYRPRHGTYSSPTSWKSPKLDRATNVIVATSSQNDLEEDSHPYTNNQFFGTAYNPKMVYAHIHMAKTSGTTVNAELANHFERVCGHKGYSYDAYALTQRLREQGDNAAKGLLRGEPYGRGRVHPSDMDEIGYADCDWISLERKWQSWLDPDAFPWQAWQDHNLTIEFHVPCRDPIDHLISQCHHFEKTFDCTNPNIRQEVQKCVIEMNRFSVELVQKHQFTVLRCYDAVPPLAYVQYMSERLQRKRLESDRVDQPTNLPRNPSEECLNDMDDTYREKVVRVLRQDYQYYQFCHLCMGSSDELTLEKDFVG